MASCCWRRMPPPPSICPSFLPKRKPAAESWGLASSPTPHSDRERGVCYWGRDSSSSCSSWIPDYKTHKIARLLCLSLVGTGHSETNFHVEGDQRNQLWLSTHHNWLPSSHRYLCSPDLGLELAFSYTQPTFPVDFGKILVTVGLVAHAQQSLAPSASARDNCLSPGIRKLAAPGDFQRK